ncbi:MAG TPA: DUF3048 domain-containing protein [Pseudonocardiaceae bacterium]
MDIGQRRSVLWQVLALVLVLLLPALLSCSSSAAPPVVPPDPLESESPSSSPSPSPPPTPPVSPFTGLATDLGAPVLCVKIDNAAPARPQTGLAAADLVYVEPVEGGISRLLAVFQSHFPPVVGPVRSARMSDLQLLANFGHPALAFSGSAAEVGAMVTQAPVLDASAPRRPGDYYRDRSRPIPHNLYADTNLVRQGGAPPRDIGFRFGPTPAGGNPVPATNVHYRATNIGVQWVPAESRWVISMDGAPLTSAAGPRPGAATVVLQRVAVRDTAVHDAAGAPSPFASTIGTGDAVVLRDGLSFNGRWSRPAADAITTFTLPDGSPLTFAPGPVWVVLVPP